MKIKSYLITILLLFFGSILMAQSNFGSLEGTVIEASTRQPLSYLDVVMFKNDIIIDQSQTDDDGKFSFQTLEPGVYKLLVYEAGEQKYERNMSIISGENQALEIKIGEAEELIEVVVTSGVEFNPENFNAPVDAKVINTAASGPAVVAAVSDPSASITPGGGISFSGVRTDANLTLIDGLPLASSAAVVGLNLQRVETKSSGVPAQLGNFIGGVISYTTNQMSKQHIRAIEYQTSSLFDRYHYNLLEGTLAGPLIIKNKGGGKDEFVQLGYAASGRLFYRNDPRPSFGGIYKVKDDVLANIEQNPLSPNPSGTGFIPTSSFLTLDDLENTQARDNVDNYDGLAQLKLEFVPNKNKKARITLYNSFNYSRDRLYGGYTNYLMNSASHPTREDYSYLGYVSYLQKIGAQKSDTNTKVKNAFINARISYQRRSVNTYIDEFDDNFFQYGHVGFFTSSPQEVYNYQTTGKQMIDQNGDTVYVRNYWERSGDFRDTALNFASSPFNPDRAAYAQSYFDYVQGELGQNVTSTTQILQAGGLINGFNVPNTYSLFNNPGAITTFYENINFEQIEAYALGQASFKFGQSDIKHDIQFGVQYQQNISSRWAIGAANLWTIMNNLVNDHIDLDRQNPILSYDDQGYFIDTVSYNWTTIDGQQTVFDRNLRQKLISGGYTDVYGNPYSETSQIDVNSLDPSLFSVDMFSADELWNNGNSLISYYGYDYKGNRTRQRFGANDFLNDSLNRSVNAYSPIYNALWIQDRFKVKDLIFRIGFRIDRYDANQLVLKDPYSLYPLRTAGEVNSLNGLDIQHPDNIGSDYAVYVNNTENPTAILGYRNGDDWFDANGLEIENPDLIEEQTSTGEIQPFLVDAENQNLVAESFEDFTPEISISPRIFFSFPISEKSIFFANYDVLTQNPDGNNFAPISTFYFLEARRGGTIANAALKPRIRTSYEAGYKQRLSKYSAISFITSYSEIRNDWGLRRIDGAYPINYTTTANIDFSTNLAFRILYDLRSFSDAFRLNANYQLLFAEGTGSNQNAQAALIQANQPNLRSIYPLDVDYRHSFNLILTHDYGVTKPEKNIYYNGSKAFKNITTSLILTARSGSPFTRDAQPTGQVLTAAVQRSPILGNPFGSRLPWVFNADLRLTKGFEIKKRKDVGSNWLIAYVNVTNLFNTRNILDVYPYTGLPDNDGYLASPIGQQEISQQIDAQSFIDLYNVKVNNPYNLQTPRWIRIGVRYSIL